MFERYLSFKKYLEFRELTLHEGAPGMDIK